MQLHIIQHVPFEGPARIYNWAMKRGHSVSITRTYEQHDFPSMDDFSSLVIMGGPMNIYEEDKYPWLKMEKKFIRKAIDSRKQIVGICLGAQLIADALGQKVYQGPQKEIGWYPVELTEEAMKNPVFKTLPKTVTAFHWHGDTFDLPESAMHVAFSQGCRNQAFLYGGRILGLQFHFESTPESVRQIADHCRHEIISGAYIQSMDTMLAQTNETYEKMNSYLNIIMDSFFKS